MDWTPGQNEAPKSAPEGNAGVDTLLARMLEPALTEFRRDFDRIRQDLAASVRALADQLERLEPLPPERVPDWPQAQEVVVSVRAEPAERDAPPEFRGETEAYPRSLEAEAPIDPVPGDFDPPLAMQPSTDVSAAGAAPESAAPPPELDPAANETVDLAAPVVPSTGEASINPLAAKLLARAEQHRRRGENVAALGRYDEVIALDPTAATAYRERGQLRRRLGQNAPALDDLNQACELDPNHADSFGSRGNILADLGRLDEALADYAYAIALRPDQALFHANRALAHARKQEFGAAIADCDQALTLDPKRFDAYFIRGVALHRRSRFDEALADFDRLLQHNPKHALAWNERGLVRASRGKYHEAVEDYARALKLQPKLLLVRFNRAVAYRLKGDYEMAIADFGEVLRRHPNQPQVHLNRGLCYLATNDFNRALDDFSRAQELLPNNSEIAERLAQAKRALRESNQSASPLPTTRRPRSKSPGKIERKREHTSQANAEAKPGTRQELKPVVAHVLTLTCPKCHGVSRYPYSRLGEPLPCKHCGKAYRMDISGRMTAVRDEARGLGCFPSLIRGKPIRIAVAAALLVAVIWPIAAMAVQHDPPRWRGYPAADLGTLAEHEPSRLEALRGLDVEVSGFILSSDGERKIVLAAREERIVCELNSDAASTKRNGAAAQTGRYVVLRGVFDSAKRGEVKITEARMGFVDPTPVRRVFLGKVFVKH